MGLRETVAAAAATAFTAIGNLAESAVYHSVAAGNATYDPVTDTQTDADVSINVTGVLVREKKRENDSNTLIDRLQFIVPYNDLGAVVPTTEDYIVIGGVTYEINDIKQVPGKAIYTFFVRAT